MRPPSTRIVIPALLAALAAPAAAQGGGPPLVVMTKSKAVAMRAAEIMGYAGELPRQTGQDGHWRLLQRPSGEVVVSTGNNLVGDTQITAHASKQLSRYTEQVIGFVSIAEKPIERALLRAGLAAEHATALAHGLVDVPRQVRKLRILITGNPLVPSQGLDLQLWMTPARDSWLSEFTTAFEPCPWAVPIVAAGEDAALTLRTAVQMKRSSTLPEQCMPMLQSLGNRTAEHDADPQEYQQAFWRTWNGVASASVNAKGQMVSISGVFQPAYMAKLYASREFHAWMQSSSVAGATIETRYVPDALQYRGVTMHKAISSPVGDASRAPFLGRQLESYTGIAGKYLVNTAFAAEGDVKTLIGRILDGKIPKQRLGETTILRISANLTTLIPLMSGGGIAAAGYPEKLTVSVGTAGPQLFMRVRF